MEEWSGEKDVKHDKRIQDQIKRKESKERLLARAKLHPNVTTRMSRTRLGYIFPLRKRKVIFPYDLHAGR